MDERSLGDEFDEIRDRLDLAYANRSACVWGTPAYERAAAELDLVFVDLRELNERAWRSTGGRPKRR